MSDGSKKNIEEVKAGESVLSFDQTTWKKGAYTVLEVQSPTPHDSHYEIALDNGAVLKLTSNHPLYAKVANIWEGWASVDPQETLKQDKMEVKKLSVGDFLKTEDNTWTKILSIKYISGDVKTYNLKTIEGAHSFFADGIWAHNKAPDTDRYKAFGPMFKFVVYPKVGDVTKWPVTTKELKAKWIEGTDSGKCSPKPSLTQSSMYLYMRVLSHGKENVESYGWASMDPDYSPTCDNDYTLGHSLIRTVVSREKIGKKPTWYPSTTFVTLPSNAPYRQLGIKIAEGDRKVYAKIYTWLDGNNKKNYICDQKPGTTDQGRIQQSYAGGILNTSGGVINCKKNDDGTTVKNLWPGFFNRGAVGYYSRAVISGEGNYTWADQTLSSPAGYEYCFGTVNYGTNNPYHIGCPSGYTPMRGSTEEAGSNCFKFKKGGDYTGLCDILPGDGSYTDPREEYDRLSCPHIISCKRIGNDASYKSDWKPETGDVLTFQPDSWSKDVQKVKIYQDFTFTVDKNGSYYFVKCEDCDATMKINGSWDGWGDHSYAAGSTYTAHFECLSGDCYYGLGIAPKDKLPTEASEDLSKTYFVPLVNKIEVHSCNESCTVNAECDVGLVCTGGKCVGSVAGVGDPDCIRCEEDINCRGSDLCKEYTCNVNSNPYLSTCSEATRPYTATKKCLNWGPCKNTNGVEVTCGGGTQSCLEPYCPDMCGCVDNSLPPSETTRRCNTTLCPETPPSPAACEVFIGLSSGSDPCKVIKVNSQGLITNEVDKTCP